MMRDGGAVSDSFSREQEAPLEPAGSPFFVALKIVAGTVSYRIRKLEMANLAAAGSIAVALQLNWLDIAVRTIFAFLLNALVYLNNDYIDVDVDMKSPDKDTTKARFLFANLRAALWAQLMMAGALALGAFVYDIGLLVPLIAGGGICWWYSAHLKRVPFMDIFAMMIWGLTMPLCGSPTTSALGWALATQLALFSGVFESIQVMRDADEDVKEGVRTTGVALGKARTLLLARIIMVGCTVYAALVLHPIAAVVSAAALLVPFAPDRIERYWTHVKLVYGVTWLFICAWVFFKGESSGLLWSISRALSITT
jgi:4-hydroxybenzoate polyprenyltransferase